MSSHPDRLQPNESAAIYAGIAIATAAIFISDLRTSLGIAVWVFYLAPLALTMFLWRPWIPFSVAAAQTAIAIAGYYLSPPGVDPEIGRINRLFGIATLWIVAGVAWHFIRGRLAVRREEWLRSGQTALSEKMAGEQSLEALAENVLHYLANRIGAQAGAIFVQSDRGYRRCAGYALPAGTAVPERVAPGEGLLGQVIADCRILNISDVPEGYFAIGSGLGQSRPRHLLIAPAVVDASPIAVLEFGAFEPFAEPAVELMRRVSNSIAMSVRSARYRSRLQALLEETQQQAEELQAQSEELRTTNEELEQQSSVLQDSQIRLEEQQSELEQTNSQLTEQTQLLEQQRDELIRSKAEIERASQYKSEFLSSMSHELRTPLNSALILARLLSENRSGNLTPEQVEYAVSIEASGNSLLELINDVLDLAKVEAGRLEMRVQTVPVARIAESLRSLFQPLARQRSLAFEIRIAPDAPQVIETDSQRLEQVLKNLLANAIKFTEEGRVELAVSRSADGRVSFQVEDTGIGIPEEQQESIFEPFRQGDSALNRKYAGTGLGLSICRELVRLLGGGISVKSAPGRGSTFTVIIPERQARGAIQPRPEERPRTLAAAAASMSGTPAPFTVPKPKLPLPHADDDRERLTGSERVILVVEDDISFAYILRDLAHELNFQCLIATTSAEALALAAQYSPSAVILDIGLPDGSGLSVLDRLKNDARTRHIPVHVASVHDYAETALSLGAVGYALKPVKREALIEALRKVEDRLSRKLRRVLVVEDDAVQRQSVEALLASPDVETVGVSSAADCLEQLRATSFDCMVLDLSLPDQSGFSLLETISQEDRYSFPPVIVYTGRDLTAEEEQGLRRYSNSIIIKGAKSPERLLDEVTLFLHQVVSELPPEQQRMLERVRNRDGVLEGRQILIVEDDVRNIFALTSLLEPRGAKVQIARNGREAIELLERLWQSETQLIDLVLMDIMMPEMDGLSATREIRKRAEWRKLPIIALTAKAMKNDHEQAIAAGANDYMAKPLDVDQFLSLLRVWMPR